MPIYEYRCTACGHRYAHLHRRLAEAAPACPECGAESPKKLFSTFSAAVAAPKNSCSLGECPTAGSCHGGGGCPLG